MKKIFFVIVAVFLVAIIFLFLINADKKNSFSLPSFFGNEKSKSSDEGLVAQNEKSSAEESAGQNFNNDKSSPNYGGTGGAGAGGGGGGAGGGGSGGSDGGENNSGNEQPSQPSCELVRPGNIPDVSCSVNYITNSEVSLKFTNEIGMPLATIVSLNNCQPESIAQTIENSQSKDFVFSCTVSDYFEEEIYVTYQLEGQTINVYGVVRGYVS